MFNNTIGGGEPKRINLYVDKSIVKKWGPLAYVSDAERQRIMNLPFGEFKPAIKILERQIKEMQKNKNNLAN